ncbi:hypothetical protein HFO42_34195 [Rhizobium leguminosarum]|uniref:Uncharacterized protein n=1 Tax=Rhizobium leguminosarum TaxID=384 RepID=A0AAJ1ERB0_RHILE|nr:hypothetical protein [Rhizobium leguminosarum]MBY3175441.1 hypothetical protein [Rhizobium leguminosarum]MBY5538181.1 hypothetical protein [Rhizobium leguminosarum]MBY5545723.1 hypothetical protein [Rhizobium leguminosarum]MBY5599332.1 hypothetical protein [Rhizobium leguminosarum]MBY5619285.1 hypothetical protein [Rhizobium leguminosarum]
MMSSCCFCRIAETIGNSIMRMFLAVASIILLGFAAPAFSQALADMDYSGRFGGMPPGTVPGAESSGGLVIPLDPVETGDINIVIPSDRTTCPRPGTRQYRAAERDGTLSDACR